MAATRLDIEALGNILHTELLGTGDSLLYIPSTDSTNIQALHLARQGAAEGLVVLADNQTAGKGRVGRHWFDRPGTSVLSSTILKPYFPTYLLVMIAALAVLDAIEKTCSIEATLKWPNDVLIGDLKVAGILVETSYDLTGQLVAVIGIGINVNGRINELIETDPSQAAPLATKATTLETVSEHPVQREQIIARLLEQLEALYLPLQYEASTATHSSVARTILKQWRAKLSTLGREIEVRQGENVLSGVAEDVNDRGELLLRCHSGKYVSITWGDIGYPTE